MTLLSLEQDKIISGASGVVAIAVTQLLCPFKVPLNINVSAIFNFLAKKTSRAGATFQETAPKL